MRLKHWGGVGDRVSGKDPGRLGLEFPLLAWELSG